MFTLWMILKKKKEAMKGKEENKGNKGNKETQERKNVSAFLVNFYSHYVFF